MQSSKGQSFQASEITVKLNTSKDRSLVSVLSFLSYFSFPFFSQAHINYKFPIDPDKEELRWQFLKPRIDSKCRAQRRLQREAQAKVNTPWDVGIPERSRSRMSRVDPKEKDQLLYGYNRTAVLGITTPRPQVAVDDFHESGTDDGENQLSDANGLDQLQTNEAIVEIAGIPVTVGEIKE